MTKTRFDCCRHDFHVPPMSSERSTVLPSCKQMWAPIPALRRSTACVNLQPSVSECPPGCLTAWLSPCRIQCRHVLYKRRTAVCCVLRDFNFISIWVELSQSDAKTKAITITKTSDYQCWVMLPEHCILFTKWGEYYCQWHIVNIKYNVHHQHKKSYRIMKSDMLMHS